MKRFVRNQSIGHRPVRLVLPFLLTLAVLVSFFTSLSRAADSVVPRPDHVVIVILENHSYPQIIGATSAPYINSLAEQGALLTQAFAVARPSQPNYLALFSGSTQGITDNTCPLTFSTPNLRSALNQAGYTFGGYAEDLNAVGSIDCVSGLYVRKHNPWVSWQGAAWHAVPPAENMPFTSFPSDLTRLPTVSMVVPNLVSNMHKGTDPNRIHNADTWLRQHLSAYVLWTQENNSLLILTWDEGDKRVDNHIPTILLGPMVKAGRYDRPVTHYDLLRTLLDMYGLSPIGEATRAKPMTDLWKPRQEKDR